MQITAVNVDDKTIWDGAKVKNLRTGIIKTVKILPEDKTISQCVREGIFTGDNVDYETFMLNKHIFELVNEDADEDHVQMVEGLRETQQMVEGLREVQDALNEATNEMMKAYDAEIKALKDVNSLILLTLGELVEEYRKTVDGLGGFSIETALRYGLPTYQKALLVYTECMKCDSLANNDIFPNETPTP